MSTALESDLRSSVEGEVRFGTVDRAIYAADSSNYREVPLGVVIPKNIEDIVRTVAACARHRAPIVHRGGGTSLAGQTVREGAVIIDSSKFCNHIWHSIPPASWPRSNPVQCWTICAMRPINMD